MIMVTNIWEIFACKYFIAIENIFSRYIILTLIHKDDAIDPLPFPLKGSKFWMSFPGVTITCSAHSHLLPLPWNNVHCTSQGLGELNKEMKLRDMIKFEQTHNINRRPLPLSLKRKRREWLPYYWGLRKKNTDIFNLQPGKEEAGG